MDELILLLPTVMDTLPAIDTVILFMAKWLLAFLIFVFLAPQIEGLGFIAWFLSGLAVYNWGM